MERAKLRWKAIARFSFGTVAYAAIFFSSAGTFRYWEAWLFMATLFVPMIFSVWYFLKKDPDFLERRLQTREHRPKQKVIQVLGAIVWLPIVLIPGLDHRFGWTTVSGEIVVLADVALLAGYYLTFLSMRENRFASRTIRVEEDQKVITTGPYELVRHPMYLGSGLMLLAAPLVLGSFLALIPNLILPGFLVLRILDEEKALLEGLPGYREYMEKTRYRLIPGVW